MAAFFALSVGFVILAGITAWLWLKLRTQGQAWSWQFDRLKEYVARLDTREAVDKQFGDLRQEISLLSAAMGEETRKAFEARRDFDHILQDFHERLDAAEAKLDIPQKRQRLRAPFSQLRGQIKSEPYKPEPNRWNADGTRVGEEVEAKA